MTIPLRYAALLLAACLAAAACRSAPLGPAAGTAHLHVANPARLPLSLAVVDGDEVRPLAELGDAAAHELDVVPGAYVLRAHMPDGDLEIAAPLFPNALPGHATLRVVVTPPPPNARTGQDFGFVPAGPAVIGDTLGIGQEDERPVRIVDVPAFLLARSEVSNAEFAVFLDAVGEVDAGWCAFDSKKFRCTRDTNGKWSTDVPDLPVVTVSLAGALAYCEWRTHATGVRHRLPSEVEWEKAARGPASFVFAYGNLYRRGAANQESGSLRAKARFAANGFGLWDMTGNAFEWTSDAWQDRKQAHGAPAEFQVLRGGSFVLDGMYLRNSFRMRQRPDVRTDDIGFRVARDLAETRSSDR
ncbi:MAG TPA: SUMF1/EgtB/PvdO family nonheme iron enzyme [Planctomycetota bacterium]|nr:SUMF1/EgtB/PvdO family nonheme iron enzyme [Planctomycetota bacterium]